jgi:hypothetical protein
MTMAPNAIRGGWASLILAFARKLNRRWCETEVSQ